MNKLQETRTPHVAVRELDRRIDGGIDVGLLWSPQTNRVWIAVTDDRAGVSFELDVDAVDALDAFHHPFTYARSGSGRARVARKP